MTDRTLDRAPRPLTAWSAFLLGVAVFLSLSGGRTAHPTVSTWMSGDAAWHQLGWQFYRAQTWTWPLGSMPHFPEPVGTAAGFVDILPGVAILLKAVSAALPASFQYLGPWLLLSFGLQAVFGARITALYTRAPLVQLLGGALFTVAPPLLFRMGHVALCSHWLLLAALEFALDARAALPRGVGWIAVAAGVHPYLLAMVMVICLPRLSRDLGLLTLALGLVAAELYVFGYLDGSEWGVAGWGRYSADALALVNALGRSRLVPGLPTTEGQYEGFAYLGLGVLVAAPAVLLLALRAGIARPAWPVVAACGALWIFSLSSVVTVGGQLVVDGRFDYFGLGDVFQSSGRFDWPLHYLVVAGVIAGVCTLARSPRAQATALAAIVAVQVAERPAWRFDPGPPTHVLSAPEWALAVGTYRAIALYPPNLGCCPAADRVDAVQVGYLASRLGMTINSARLSRDRCGAQEAYCEQLAARVERGRLEPGVIYVVAPSARPRFAGAVCGRLDELDVCVAEAPDQVADPFARALRRPNETEGLSPVK